MEYGILLRLAGGMNVILILFRSFTIQGREPYLRDFFKNNNHHQTKPFNIGLYSNLLQTDFFLTWYDVRDH